MSQRGGTAGEHVLQLGRVLVLLFFQLKHQCIQFVAGVRIQITLAKGIGSNGPPLTKDAGDGRGHGGQQLRQHAHIPLAVLAEPGLAGNQLDHHLRLTQQCPRHGRLGLQRLLRLGITQGRREGVATPVEFFDLLSIIADRRQALHARRQLTFGVCQPCHQPLLAARLADDAFDLDQVLPVFHLPSQLQRTAQQLQAFQLMASTDELPVRIAHQVEIGQQHGYEEKHTDQAEFQGETQAIHQCNGGTQQAVQKTSPNFLLLCLQLRWLQQGSSER